MTAQGMKKPSASPTYEENCSKYSPAPRLSHLPYPYSNYQSPYCGYSPYDQRSYGSGISYPFPVEGSLDGAVTTRPSMVLSSNSSINHLSWRNSAI